MYYLPYIVTILYFCTSFVKGKKLTFTGYMLYGNVVNNKIH